jgi:hypothetical protein
MYAYWLVLFNFDPKKMLLKLSCQPVCQFKPKIQKSTQAFAKAAKDSLSKAIKSDSKINISGS